MQQDTLTARPQSMKGRHSGFANEGGGVSPRTNKSSRTPSPGNRGSSFASTGTNKAKKPTTPRQDRGAGLGSDISLPPEIERWLYSLKVSSPEAVRSAQLSHRHPLHPSCMLSFPSAHTSSTSSLCNQSEVKIQVPSHIPAEASWLLLTICFSTTCVSSSIDLSDGIVVAKILEAHFKDEVRSGKVPMLLNMETGQTLKARRSNWANILDATKRLGVLWALGSLGPPTHPPHVTITGIGDVLSDYDVAAVSLGRGSAAVSLMTRLHERLKTFNDKSAQSMPGTALLPPSFLCPNVPHRRTVLSRTHRSRTTVRHCFGPTSLQPSNGQVLQRRGRFLQPRSGKGLELHIGRQR